MTTLHLGFVTETCCHQGCSVMWAFTTDYYNSVRESHAWWYCPNGHRQHYTADNTAEQLRKAKARELALQDQLGASIREGELTRTALLRDRQRIANGVCVCCNRSFQNVRRHMENQHPDFPVAHVNPEDDYPYKCSCGDGFSTFRGLRIHQGRLRDDDWDKPDTAPYWAHLTRV